MRILTLPKSMTEEEALKIARKGGNIFGRLLYGNKDIIMKLMYLESREIVYSMSYLKAPLVRLIVGEETKTPGQKIRLMVEGTRCIPSYVEEELSPIELEIEEEDMIQKSTFTDEIMIEKGKQLVRKMLRRQIGRTVSAKAEAVRSIYRPFYIAFYEELVEGTKVHYLAIPADGNEIRKTC